MAAPKCKCGSLQWNDEGRCRACNRFPTLGYLVGDFIEAKFAIPDRDQVGDPYLLTDEMWRFLLHFYRINPHTRQDGRGRWSLPFTYVRGGQLTRPQKWGKGPFLGAILGTEATGPVVFDGWDANGQPVGRPWATPIVQIAASSEDQTDNVWMALLPMITLGDLGAEVPETGLKRIYLPNGGWIEPVTSAARSRLGQRITFLGQDQTESWTEGNGGRSLADTQRRNIAGMGGRWLSTNNAWDPAEKSVAQYTAEVEVLEGDVFHDDVEPPENLSVRNKAERRRGLRHVYGDSWWVDLDRVDAEIVALLKRDPAQAERWYLNRKRAREAAAFQLANLLVEGDTDFDAEKSRVVKRDEPEKGSRIVLFADGARYADSLAINACDVATGYIWPIGIWEVPENADDDYEHPLDDVDAAVAEAFETYDVWRFYCDPQYIEGLVEKWQGEYGDKVVIEWRTNRPRQIAHAVRQFTEALGSGEASLSADPVFLQQLKNAVKQKVNVYDDKHVQMHTISKDRPDSANKMDAAMAAVGAWEARGDCIAKGEAKPKKRRAIGIN